MFTKPGELLRSITPLAVGAVFAVAGLGILLWKLDTVALYPGLPRNEKLDTVRVYLLAVGGALLILQIYIANRRATSAERTAELTALGNITERMNSAIGNIGSEQKVVRIGGLHQLHHIARDAPEYRLTVFELMNIHSRLINREENEDEWDITARMLHQNIRDGGVYYDPNAEDGPRSQS
jgi:hypothetical protein